MRASLDIVGLPVDASFLEFCDLLEDGIRAGDDGLWVIGFVIVQHCEEVMESLVCLVLLDGDFYEFYCAVKVHLLPVQQSCVVQRIYALFIIDDRLVCELCALAVALGLPGLVAHDISDYVWDH